MKGRQSRVRSRSRRRRRCRTTGGGKVPSERTTRKKRIREFGRARFQPSKLQPNCKPECSYARGHHADCPARAEYVRWKRHTAEHMRMSAADLRRKGTLKREYKNYKMPQNTRVGSIWNEDPVPLSIAASIWGDAPPLVVSPGASQRLNKTLAKTKSFRKSKSPR